MKKIYAILLSVTKVFEILFLVLSVLAAKVLAISIKISRSERIPHAGSYWLFVKLWFSVLLN